MIETNGINRFATLSWMPDERSYRPGEQVFGDIEMQSSVTRGLEAVKVLDRYFKGATSLSILTVGLGYHSDIFICPFETYQIAAYLESRQIDYSMVLLDKNVDPINDIQNRKQVMLPVYYYDTDIKSKLAWDAYVRRTGSKVKTVHELTSDIEVNPEMSELEKEDLQDALIQGLLVAPIPTSLGTGFKDGRIHTLNQPVENANVSKFGLFDFVSCTNLLYLLSEDGQKLALANIAASIKPLGKLLINCRYAAILPKGCDPKKYTGAALFPEHDGWMIPDRLNDLGLRIISQSKESREGFITAVIQKE